MDHKPAEAPIEGAVTNDNTGVTFPPSDAASGENPTKGYVQAVVLSSFFGYVGADRFYLNKVVTGILKIITFGGLGIWVLIDAVRAIMGKARQKDSDAALFGTAQYKPFFGKVLLAWAVLTVVMCIGSILFWAAITPVLIKQVEKQQFCATVAGSKQCKSIQHWIDDYRNLQQENPDLKQYIDQNPDVVQNLQNNPNIQQYLRDHPELTVPTGTN